MQERLDFLIEILVRGGRIPHVVSGSVGPPKSINRVKTICMANYDR